MSSLRVMARSTIFRFKGASDPREAGRKLGVGAVLAGSVARRGDRISISAELVDVSTGARLWGDRFERPFAALMQVQDSLAAEIADGLRLSLSGEQRQDLARHGTDSAEAYALGLKARHLLARESVDDDLEARRLAVQALEVDPAFLDARLTVVATYARAATNGWAPPAEAWRAADVEIEKARALAPRDVRVRCAAANRRFLVDWDWVGAGEEFAAIEADPTLLQGEPFRALCMYRWARGQTERGIALLERALHVDPGNLESRIMLADFLSHAGRLDEAASRYETIAAKSRARPRLSSAWPSSGGCAATCRAPSRRCAGRTSARRRDRRSGARLGEEGEGLRRDRGGGGACAALGRARAGRTPLRLAARARSAVGPGRRQGEGAREPRRRARRTLSGAGLSEGRAGLGPCPRRSSLRRRRPQRGHPVDPVGAAFPRGAVSATLRKINLSGSGL